MKSPRSIHKSHHTEPLQQVVPQTPILMSTEAFASNFPSEYPFSCYSSTWVIISKQLMWGLVQHFPRVKGCRMSPNTVALSAFCCIFLYHQQSTVSKATILHPAKVHVTATCPSSTSSIWSFVSSQHLPFASSTKPISFLVLFMVTTVLLPVILLCTIFTAHTRNHFLKIHLTCLGVLDQSHLFEKMILKSAQIFQQFRVASF